MTRKTAIHSAIEAATGITYHDVIADAFEARLNAAGYTVTPVEPTEAMVAAAMRMAGTPFDAEAGKTAIRNYRAMLAAATPPKGESHEA